MSDDSDVLTQAPPLAPSGSVPPPMSRADVADYLDRSNWDPDKARAMAAHERLSNLGVHPALVAQAVAPQMPQEASAAPPASPSIPPSPVTPTQPGRVVSLTPKPAPIRAPKAAPIDLSAGFVPKNVAPASADGGIDLSAGLVPKEQADTGILATAARAGKTFAQGVGIPTTQEELAAAQPTLAEKIGGPAVTAGKMVYNYGKNLINQGKESLGEAYEAGQNIGEGGPVAENIGKAGAAASDLVLKGILGPVGGASTAKAGEEIAAGDQTPEAIGDIGAATVNALTAKDLLKGKHPATETPIPGAPLTPGEAAGPGVLRSGEQLVSKVGSAQKPVRDFMENRTKVIQNAAEGVAPQTPTPEATGAAVQDAARSVVGGKEQAAGLVDQFGDRAKQQLEDAKQAATDSEEAQTQAEAERQGSAMQDTAAQELDRRRSTSVEQANDIAKAISGGHDELPVPEADRKIIESLRSNNQAAKAEESGAHEALSKAAKARGIVVDTKPMQDVAKGVVQLEGPARDLVTSSLPSSVLKMLEKAAEGEAANSPLDPYAEAMTGRNYVELKSLVDNPPTGKAASRGAGGTYWSDALEKVEAEAAKDGIQPMEAGVPYDIMKTGRTAVRESLQGARKHFQQTGMGGNAVRVLSDLHGSMTDAMKKSLEPHEDLTQHFNQANALTIDRASRFVDPKFIRGLVYKGDSAKVIGAVMRSGGQVEAEALVKALGNDPLAMGPLKRAAMDFTLRRSMKTPTGELPGTVEPSKMDYDLAVRNVEKTPALRTILGEDGYQKFHDDLEAKRLAARDPDEVRFDGYLQRVVKADAPEKAAKLAGDQGNLARLQQRNPDVAARPIDTATGERTVSQAEKRLAGTKAASDRLRTPELPEKGVQKVAKGVSEELNPSSIVEKAAKEPEYTDKLLDVIDKAPNPQAMRMQLGQRIFRNATDDAMVNGAFGSNNGVFDVGKFDAAYRQSRPSLAKILPADNVKAMDGFADALKQYSLSNGVGAQGGMSSRMLVIRQLTAIGSLIRGVVSLSPTALATGITIEAGPRLWMELATRPDVTRAVSASLRAGSVTLGAGIIGAKAHQSPENVSPSQASNTNTPIITKNAMANISTAQNPTTEQTGDIQPESAAKTKRSGFDHPSRQADKEAGWKAALKSKSTPAHLRPHLEKNLSQ